MRYADWFRLDFSASGGPDGFGYADFEGHRHLVALNHANAAVVDYAVRVMTHWLDRGADGWRLDAAYAAPAAFGREVIGRVRRTHPGASARSPSPETTTSPGSPAGSPTTATSARPSPCSSPSPACPASTTATSRASVTSRRSARGRRRHPSGVSRRPADLSPQGWSVNHERQRLIAMRRRNGWLTGARTSIRHLSNQQLSYETSAGPYSLTVLLKRADEAFRFEPGADGSLTRSQRDRS